MNVLSLILLIPLAVVVSLVITLQIVMKRRIINLTHAQFVGVGGIPFTLAVLTYVIYHLLYTSNSGMVDMAVTVGAIGAMIGGWIGASVACVTNHSRSGVPKLEGEYQFTVAKATSQGQRNTVNDRLQRYALLDTRSNVRLYLLGSFVVLVLFVTVMNRMDILGFWDRANLIHLPSSWRILGAIAPFAFPCLLWAVLRRRLPALGFGLRDSIFSLMIIYVVFYAVFNMLAAPPAR